MLGAYKADLEPEYRSMARSKSVAKKCARSASIQQAQCCQAEDALYIPALIA